MISLLDYLQENLIMTDIKASDKFGAMEEMVDFLKKKNHIKDKDDALDLLRQREEIYSTGIGRSLAVPHALSKKIEKTTLALAYVKNGIPFESIDHAPVHFIFLLLGPEENQRLHLQLLAKIARIFRDRDLRDNLFECKSAKAILEVIARYEKKYST